jgi:arylsulfatase A-like enzyme
MDPSADRIRVGRRSARFAVACAAATVALGAVVSGAEIKAAAAQGPPNVLLIITDDHRDGGESMSVLQETGRLFASEGTEFSDAYATTPMCCPSRASIFSGRYVHNHGVTDNGSNLARLELTWQRHLDEAGYETALFGKYLNSWLDRRPRDPIPYFDDSWQGYDLHHGKNPLEAERFLAERATGFLERAERDDPRPWAMVLATRSPHLPYRYPDRFRRDVGRFVPRPSVHDDLGDKPPYVRRAGRALDRRIRRGAEMRRPRNLFTGQLRELMAVDEMVGGIFASLRRMSEDDGTLAILVSDNGFFWGEHSLPGKKLPYREAIEVPMYVRWPGRVAAGAVDDRIVANIDLAPTILDAAGVEPRYRPDGHSLLDLDWERRGLLLEGPKRLWSSYLRPGKQYVRWADGSREYYDLRRDPFQEHNALASSAAVVGGHRARPSRRRRLTVRRSVARREARRMQVALHRAARCAGRACP